MSEVRELEDVTIGYEGIFNIQELYQVIDEFLRTKGYGKTENVNREVVHESGKDIFIVMSPSKDHTDYVEKMISIVLDIRNAKDVEVTIDGKKRKMQKAKINIDLQAILKTDWEGKWNDKNAFFLIRAIYDKWIFKSHTQSYAAETVSDMHFLRDQLKGYLNLSRQRV